MSKKVSRGKLIGLVFTLLAVGLASCEPCLDCGPDNNFPFVNFTVLNRTSLDTLTQRQAETNGRIEQLELARESATNTREIDSINLLIDQFTAIRASLQRKITHTENRLIRIDRINGQENLFFDSFRNTDSLRLFRLPLNANDTISRFVIEIANVQAELEVTYQLDLNVVNRKLKSSAFNLRILSHTFNELSFIRGCPGRDTLCNTNLGQIDVEI
jgi:hypothetical protein